MDLWNDSSVKKRTHEQNLERHKTRNRVVQDLKFSEFSLLRLSRVTGLRVGPYIYIYIYIYIVRYILLYSILYSFVINILYCAILY